MSAELYLNIILVSVVLLVVTLLIAKYEFKQQHLFVIRERLLAKVYSLRLSKMLTYLGIDTKKYILHVPPKDIASHIRKCQLCPEIPTCDACLRDGRVVTDMNFCPNFKSLTKHSKTIYKKSK